MAVIPVVITTVGRGDGSAKLFVWANVTSATSDTCQPADTTDLSDKSIHVSGTFGGCSVALNGSNNGFATAGGALRSPDSTTIAITTETVKAVLENTQQIKPIATGGTGQTITISILCKQTNPLRQ